jgi:uncharacterized membrane protein
MVELQAVRERLRQSLWFIPTLFAVGAALLGAVLLAVDRDLALAGSAAAFAFGGTAEGARSVLSTIAQSMLTFTGLVFTITMLVLQLASSQLSPRVMRTFLRDRANQLVLGLFIATFVYTLVVLREVRTPVDGSEGFVPAVSVWAAFVLLLASVGAFVYYIDHMAHAIRASTVIDNIWTETQAAIDRLYPERLGRAAPAAEPSFPADDSGPPLPAPVAGVVTGVDEAGLLEAVEQADRRLQLLHRIGDFVPSGAPLARHWGAWDDGALDAVRRAIGLGRERTLHQDAAFGFRQLVDVAVRALSTSTNDPTTAVQALDRIHDLLRRLAERQIPSPVRMDEDGVPRLILPRPGWDDYVRLGLDEIRLHGAGQVQVVTRLRALLDDLATVASGDRLLVLRDQRARLDAEMEPAVRSIVG